MNETAAERFYREADERAQRQAEADRVARLNWGWEKLCPPKYRNFDLARLPADTDRSKVQRILDWKNNAEGKGLYILGKTGRGKYA